MFIDRATEVQSCEAYCMYRTYHTRINQSLTVHLGVAIFVNRKGKNIFNNLVVFLFVCFLQITNYFAILTQY